MSDLIIYEKRTCTTCRRLVQLLTDRGIAFDRVEYRSTPERRDGRCYRCAVHLLAASGAAGGWVGELVDTWGYVAVALFLVVENVFPPIPSELILPLAGYYVEQGNLNFAFAVVAATLGSVIGALILYGFGQLAGRPALEKWGHKVHLHERDIERADRWFERYGGWVVFFGRLVPGVRSVVSIPAGASSMAMPQFVLLTTAGSALWNALLIGAGWWLGREWERITGVMDSASTVVVVAVVVSFVGGATLFLRRRRRALAQ
jgi:membrane protein DedA with SNARE-associated domain